MVVEFQWLKKYQNDENFTKHDFNIYEADLIKKALIDQYFIQIKFALEQFQKYILNTLKLHQNLKFKYETTISSPNDIIATEYIIVFDENYFEKWQKIELGLFFSFEKLEFNSDHKLIDDLKHFFLHDEMDGIYYINDNDKNNVNNPINQEIRKKIKELKLCVDFCKKQLSIFVDSVNKFFLWSSKELIDLIPFLGWIVAINRNQLDYRAIARNKSEIRLQQTIVDSMDRRKFNDWTKDYYYVYKYIPKESWLFVTNNEYRDFFNYLHCERQKYVHNETINFAMVIKDFLPLAENNYRIIALEKAVASYILGVFNDKNISIFNTEDFIAKYGEYFMKLLATTVTCAAIVYVVNCFAPISDTSNMVGNIHKMIGGEMKKIIGENGASNIMPQNNIYDVSKTTLLDGQSVINTSGSLGTVAGVAGGYSYFNKSTKQNNDLTKQVFVEDQKKWLIKIILITLSKIWTFYRGISKDWV